MRTLRISSVILLALTTSLLAQTNEATTNSNPVVAYIYVGNDAKPGEISAFSAQKNGSLATVSGSPFATAASQAIVVSSGFLFGTDGTNIVVFKRSTDGALHEASSISGVAHNPTPEGSAVGVLTLDRTAGSLYASEINFQGTDNGGYEEFANLHDGKITFLADSVISSDFGSTLQFSVNDEFTYGSGCFFASWDVFGFHRTSTGELAMFDPGNTVPPNPTNNFLCPGGQATSAKGFMAIMYGPAEAGSKQNIITYHITSTGGLEEIPASVIATNFIGASLQFDPTGTFLAAAGQNGVEIFKLNSEGLLTPLGSMMEPSVAFVGAHWDNAGHLYAISNAALYVFTMGSAGLTQTGSPHPVAHAFWLAVLPQP
jgi:6-phosphogluconolactonase (cycloisomerase 2 family)